MTDSRVAISIDKLIAAHVYRFADQPSSKRKRPANECHECGKPWRTAKQAARCCTPYGCAAATLLEFAETGTREDTTYEAPRVTPADFLALRRQLDSPMPDIVERVLYVWACTDQDWIRLLAFLAELVDENRC